MSNIDHRFRRSSAHNEARNNIEKGLPRPISERHMVTTFGSTLLACGGIFALSFGAIWAFWFVERLRGASAPKL
jgi:hypothetical protein